MKTKVKVDGVIITNKSDIKDWFKAIEKTGVDINYSAVGRKLGKSPSSVFDSWNNFLERNDVEVVIDIKGRV